MKIRITNPILLGLLIMLLTGCMHAISRQNREAALVDVAPESILKNFDNQKGKLVLMGGEIVEMRNQGKEAVIEIIQKPLSRSTDRPLENGRVDGRFLVKYSESKDPAVYAKGREITVVGTVVGKEGLKTNQKEYTYVVLQNRETYLWPEQPASYEGYYQSLGGRPAYPYPLGGGPYRYPWETGYPNPWNSWP
jgi:outer membrane lipoprotein